jgi:plastocyanin
VIRRYLASLGLSLAVILGSSIPAFATPTTSGPQTLVIGVDYNDPLDQQESQHRWFEYTDFFTRQVSVHTGDILDFRAAPGSSHIVGLAANETLARQVYPVYFPVPDPQPAPGTGLPKLGLGVSQVAITGGSTSGGGQIGNDPFGPPVCGDVSLGQPLCTFSGGNDVEIAGPNPGLDLTKNPPVPAAVDWDIVINAPPGTYAYFCTIHPGMRGTVTVVSANQPTTTQSAITFGSYVQFAFDWSEAIVAEALANIVHYTGGAPGTRTYTQNVGVGVYDGHVSIDEMVPQQISGLVPGDKVQFVWGDTHATHTVTFPSNSPTLPSPFGYDCGTTYQSVYGPPLPPPCIDPTLGIPLAIGDPGTTASGSALTSPALLVDSGVLIGSAFGLTPSTQSWSAVISSVSAPGAYQYECTVHDWMQGTLNVQSAGTAVPRVQPAQSPTPVKAKPPFSRRRG